MPLKTDLKGHFRTNYDGGGPPESWAKGSRLGGEVLADPFDNEVMILLRRKA